MKVLNDVPLDQYIKDAKGSRYELAEKFVDEFWPSFSQMTDKGTGKLIDIKSSPDEKWLTAQQVKDMPWKEKATYKLMIRGRIYWLLQIMRSKIHIASKHKIVWFYAGNGQIVIGWKYVRTKINRPPNDRIKK